TVPAISVDQGIGIRRGRLSSKRAGKIHGWVVGRAQCAGSRNRGDRVVALRCARGGSIGCGAMKKPRILLVEDGNGLRAQLSWALESFDVVTADDRSKALRVIQDERLPVVILDLGLPPDPDGASEGLQAIREILAVAPQTKIIVSTGNESRANAV